MKRSLLPLTALIGFSAYTLFVMTQAEQSLLQFGIELMSNLDTAQVVIDLYILATLACIWMYQDAKARGRSLLSVLPFLLLTALFASIGPLLYLLVRSLAPPLPGEADVGLRQGGQAQPPALAVRQTQVSITPDGGRSE